jgi:hypothetical protein
VSSEEGNEDMRGSQYRYCIRIGRDEEIGWLPGTGVGLKVFWVIDQVGSGVRFPGKVFRYELESYLE